MIQLDKKNKEIRKKNKSIELCIIIAFLKQGETTYSLKFKNLNGNDFVAKFFYPNIPH